MGTDALGQSFRIVTETVAVSCHGCKYRSKHYVPKHSVVKIEIACLGLPQRIVSGRVVWVQRPRSVNEEFNIGLEFDTPENVWGIAPPPEDWLPFCNDKTAAVPAFEATTAVVEVETPASAESSGWMFTSSDLVGQIETSYDMTTLQAESREAKLQEIIERAVEKSIARLSESAVQQIVQQLTGALTAAITEKVCQEITDKLDGRILKEDTSIR
jgi:hypothetical protein